MCSSSRYGANRHGVHIHQSGHAFHHKKAFHVSRLLEDLPVEQMSPVAAEVARVLLDDAVTPGVVLVPHVVAAGCPWGWRRAARRHDAGFSRHPDAYEGAASRQRPRCRPEQPENAHG